MINKLNILPSSALNVLRTFNFSSKENVVARKPVLFLMSIIEDDANRLDRIMHSGLVFRHSSRMISYILLCFVVMQIEFYLSILTLVNVVSVFLNGLRSHCLVR